MMKEIGDTVIAALRAGSEAALRRDGRKALEEWADYAATLEAQIERLRAGLRATLLQVAQQDVIIRNQQSVIEEKTEIIAKKNTLIARLDNEFLDLAAQQEKSKTYLTEKLIATQRQSQANSAKLTAYEEIYKLLVQEIHAIDDPSRFKNLDPEVRFTVMEKTWNNFLRTGKVNYDPDLNFTYLPEPKKTASEP